jgi:hypothetical protein
MKYLIIGVFLAVLGLAAYDSHAAAPDKLIYQNEMVTVVLHPTPCENETVKAQVTEADPEWLPEWFKAEVTWLGQPLEACYAGVIDEDNLLQILIVDQTGDAGFLPVEDFKPYDEAAI